MTTQTKLYCQQIRVTITNSYYFEYYIILNNKSNLYSILLYVQIKHILLFDLHIAVGYTTLSELVSNSYVK